MQLRISALGRERDAPGQTSALTLGPGPWLLPAPCQPLFRLSLDMRLSARRLGGAGRQYRHSLLQAETERAAPRARRCQRPPRMGWGSRRTVSPAPPAHPSSAPSCVLPAGWGRPGRPARTTPSGPCPVPGTESSPGMVAQETPPQPSRSLSTGFTWILSSI